MSSCMTWLQEAEKDNNTVLSLDDLNTFAMTRNLGGLIFVCVLMVLGFFGNLFVIIIYSCRMKKSNNYTVYILCLGFLDFTNCCLTMPFIVAYLLYPLNFPSSALCKAGHFVAYWLGIGSPFVLVLIAIDRYRRICQPFKRQLSERQARLCCVLSIFGALAFAWPSAILYGNGTIDTGILNITGTRCFKDDNSMFEKFQNTYYVMLSSLSLTVSCCLFVPYYFIMKKVRHQTIYWRSSKMNGRKGCKKAKESRKTAWTFFVVTTVYVLSTLPHDALALVLHLKGNLECELGFSGGAVFYTFLFTVFINNVANPFIYGFSDDRFYIEIKNILSGKSDKNLQGRSRTQSNSSESFGSSVGGRIGSDSNMWRTDSSGSQKVLAGNPPVCLNPSVG